MQDLRVGVGTKAYIFLILLYLLFGCAGSSLLCRLSLVVVWVRVFSVALSCPTLCDPVDCSPPGSSVHGILQARILEWVVMPSSRGSS